MSFALASRPADRRRSRSGSPSARCPAPTISGRELAAHRLLMGVARTTLASAMGVNHMRLAAAEHSPNPLDAKRYERWRTALTQTARRKLEALGSQGFKLEELPEPMRKIFELYLS